MVTASSCATEENDQPTVEGQVIADGKTIAIYGRLWRATQLETHGVTGFVVTPADTAPELT
jgi:hypothetical protein